MKEKTALIILVVIGAFTIITVALFSVLNIQLAPAYSLILSAALVAVTAVYVYLTSRTVNASNRQAEIMLNAEFNAAAPVIKLHAGTSGSTVNVDFQNVGKGPALNFKC